MLGKKVGTLVTLSCFIITGKISQADIGKMYVLPCLAHTEKRQGQKGWEKITGRYVGAFDITYAESTDHFRTTVNENLLVSTL